MRRLPVDERPERSARQLDEDELERKLLTPDELPSESAQMPVPDPSPVPPDDAQPVAATRPEERSGEHGGVRASVVEELAPEPGHRSAMAVANERVGPVHECGVGFGEALEGIEIAAAACCRSSVEGGIEPADPRRVPLA